VFQFLLSFCVNLHLFMLCWACLHHGWVSLLLLVLWWKLTWDYCLTLTSMVMLG
jgi:uncharacterized membrane protein